MRSAPALAAFLVLTALMGCAGAPPVPPAPHPERSAGAPIKASAGPSVTTTTRAALVDETVRRVRADAPEVQPYSIAIVGGDAEEGRSVVDALKRELARDPRVVFAEPLRAAPPQEDRSGTAAPRVPAADSRWIPEPRLLLRVDSSDGTLTVSATREAPSAPDSTTRWQWILKTDDNAAGRDAGASNAAPYSHFSVGFHSTPFAFARILLTYA